LNHLVLYDAGKSSLKGVLNFSVRNAIWTAVGRPRKFSREGVLQKALPVFWKYGFARTTLPDLEQATGVNKSGLYAEFESKEALFLACLKHYLDTRNGGALLMAEPLGWRNIERFLEEAPSCALDQRGCFSVNSMRELEGLPAEARKTITDGRTKLKRLLRANIASEKPKMSVDALCELVSAFFSGICIEANLNAGRTRARRKIKDFMQMIKAAGSTDPGLRTDRKR
jgi:AcrR family transcriptional regulator